MMKSFRQFYTSEVVNEAMNIGKMHVTHDYYEERYDTFGGAIPLPATLSLLLAQQFSSSDIKVNLKSGYPFPWRKDTILTSFEKNALNHFINHSEDSEPYKKYDRNRNLLLYAVPDKMIHESCVQCHNTHPQSPKRDWKLGDVRGIITIEKPVHNIEMLARTNTITYWYISILIIAGLIAIVLIIRLSILSTKTIRNIYEEQLIHSENLATIGELTSGVAHDLKNPINFVNIGIQPLSTDTKELISLLEKYELLNNENSNQSIIEEIENYKEEIDYQFLKENIINTISDIKMGAKQTVSILEGLKSFSRKSDNTMLLANVHDGIRDTLTLLHSKLKHKVEVITEFDEHIQPFLCLPGELNQVFMNIIANAEQAIETKGTIHIRTQLKQDKVCISIKDDGPGMDNVTMDNIFTAFYTTKDLGKGTGLGLSISKSIIVKHGGTIEVKSEIGQGSTFIIYLPYNQ